jgi:anti-sigma-K factor RskA
MSDVMHAPHAEFADDLAVYALGGLDDDSATRVEDHLATCPTCRATLVEYQEVTRLLPLALPSAQPPADARDALLASAAGGRKGAWRRRLARRLPRGAPARLALAGLAAVVLLAVGVALWAATRDDAPPDPADVVGQLQESDDVRVLAMTGSENAPDAVGQLIMAPDREQAGLVASGLPILERGHCYQLWFVHDDGTRSSGGIFWEEPDGSAITLVTVPGDLSHFRWFGVTEEPYPGSAAPTGPSVLGGEL